MSGSWSVRLDATAQKAVEELQDTWGLNRTDTLRRLVNLGFQHLAENESLSASHALESLEKDLGELRRVAERQDTTSQELQAGLANAMEILLLATKAFGDPSDPEQREQVLEQTAAWVKAKIRRADSESSPGRTEGE